MRGERREGSEPHRHRESGGHRRREEKRSGFDDRRHSDEAGRPAGWRGSEDAYVGRGGQRYREYSNPQSPWEGEHSRGGWGSQGRDDSDRYGHEYGWGRHQGRDRDRDRPASGDGRYFGPSGRYDDRRGPPPGDRDEGRYSDHRGDRWRPPSGSWDEPRGWSEDGADRRGRPRGEYRRPSPGEYRRPTSDERDGRRGLPPVVREDSLGPSPGSREGPPAGDRDDRLGSPPCDLRGPATGPGGPYHPRGGRGEETTAVVRKARVRRWDAGADPVPDAQAGEPGAGPLQAPPLPDDDLLLGPPPPPPPLPSDFGPDVPVSGFDTGATSFPQSQEGLGVAW